jgi:hypothetical protein
MLSNSKCRPPVASHCPVKTKKKTKAASWARQKKNRNPAQRFSLALPQNVQVYRACWVISILEGQSRKVSLLDHEPVFSLRTFLTCLRREAP